ncbi:Double-stranded RNA-specific editase 1 [Varanus komodoensis]|nr:Double-stranded RNA-specific editase 1 [Varanus komodoensis]
MLSMGSRWVSEEDFPDVQPESGMPQLDLIILCPMLWHQQEENLTFLFVTAFEVEELALVLIEFHSVGFSPLFKFIKIALDLHSVFCLAIAPSISNAEARQPGKAPNFSVNWTVGDAGLEVINATTGKDEMGRASRLCKHALYSRWMCIYAKEKVRALEQQVSTLRRIKENEEFLDRAEELEQVSVVQKEKEHQQAEAAEENPEGRENESAQILLDLEYLLLSCGHCPHFSITCEFVQQTVHPLFYVVDEKIE